MNLNNEKGLNYVTVDRKDLLEKLTLNKEKHETELIESLNGFYKHSKLKLENALTSIKNKKNPKDLFFQKPESHVDDYEQMIEMMKMSIDDEIIMTSNQFKRYVMDKWEWSKMFKDLHSEYTSVK